MSIRRRIRQFRAALGGYFWLPCPLCGQHFSGLEWQRAGFPAWPNPDGCRNGICKDCARSRV